MVRLAVDNGRSTAHAEQRRALLATVHIARKALGMVEDDYRAMLHRVTGKASAKDCDNLHLGKVVSEFERMGFRSSARTPRRAPAASAVARKARALWISLHRLGAINDPSEAKLETFGKRQLRVDRLHWADEREGFRLIEALKAIATRHGWDQTISSRLPGPERIRILRDRLIAAQLARLAAAGIAVPEPLTADRAGWSDKRLQRAADELGALIHATAAATTPTASI